MEPHPIPQNISSFQFRLVGDMTLKQFAYLALGSTLGYLIFVFFAASYPFFAWPLITISAGLGIAFAFLGIGSRPLDYWLAAFLKAVYSPTKRVWRKNNENYKEDPLFKSRYVMYMSRQGEPNQPTIPPSPQPPQSFLMPTPPPPQLPTPDELKKTVDLAKQAQNLQMKIIQTERTLNQIRSEAQKSTPIPADYTTKIIAILSDLQKLVEEASSVKEQLQAIEEPQPSIKPHKIVKVAVQPRKPQTIALTSFPNVINGIVKDQGGNYLEGVIAVIHDKEGLPVRALKTNKLGQFTGSTPLPNGVYTLELEKENYEFDVLQIELQGSLLQPLLITAKGDS